LNKLSAAWTDLKAVFVPILTPVFEFLTEQVKKLASDLNILILEFKVAKAIIETFFAPIDQQAAKAKEAAEAYQEWKKAIEEKTQQSQQDKQAADTTNLSLNMTSQALEQTGQAAEQAGQQVEQGMDVATEAINENTAALQTDAWASWTAAAVSGAQAAAKAIADLNNEIAAMAFIRPDISGGGQGASIGEAAQGGLLGGRGTGTSDSNLAWVSRGEHIMPARAVAQPGVLAFLEALRRSGGNLRGVLDGMGRFALGGLVPRPTLAFADGGPVGGMSHVTIQFPGLPPIAGLRASSAVVDELHRAAALAQVRSGGRKPSRYS
jgi:hypothetical protein